MYYEYLFTSKKGHKITNVFHGKIAGVQAMNYANKLSEKYCTTFDYKLN